MHKFKYSKLKVSVEKTITSIMNESIMNQASRVMYTCGSAVERRPECKRSGVRFADALISQAKKMVFHIGCVKKQKAMLS